MPSGRRTQFHHPSGSLSSGARRRSPKGTWRGLGICRRQTAGHPDPQAQTHLSHGTGSDRILPVEGQRRVTCSLFRLRTLLRLRRRRASFGLRFPEASGCPRRSDSISQGSWPRRRSLVSALRSRRASACLRLGSPTPRQGQRARWTFAKPSWAFPSPPCVPSRGTPWDSSQPPPLLVLLLVLHCSFLICHCFDNVSVYRFST